MALDELFQHLGRKYTESKLVPPTKMKTAESREYGLYPLREASFVNYEPTTLKGKFRVLAVDAGSIASRKTPYGLILIDARHHGE